MALREGCGALRWEVLAWNQPAIDFYKRLGAIFLDDWKAVRIDGEAFPRVAGQSKARLGAVLDARCFVRGTD